MEKKREPSSDRTLAEEADKSKVWHTEHGIPADAAENEPTGLPSSDRHHTEVAPVKT